MKIIRNPAFKAAVRVTVPTEHGQKEQEFTARFRALTVSEQKEYDLGTADGTDAFLRYVLLGWDDLTEEDGAAFEFTPANHAALIDLPYIRVALTRTYFNAINGIKAAKAGN